MNEPISEQYNYFSVCFLYNKFSNCQMTFDDVFKAHVNVETVKTCLGIETYL